METSSLFAQVIQDHLELKQKNSELEGELPLDRYKTEDPFENHPLFKTEEQARIEETMDGEEPAITRARPARLADRRVGGREGRPLEPVARLRLGRLRCGACGSPCSAPRSRTSSTPTTARAAARPRPSGSRDLRARSPTELIEDLVGKARDTK